MKISAMVRRNRYAPVVLLLFALFLTAGIYSVVAPGSATATQGTSEANVQEGEAIFEANCASCHGPDAAGTDIAPSLTGVGAASVHFQMITGRMPMANNSPQAEVKDVQFTEEQIYDASPLRCNAWPRPGNSVRRLGRSREGRSGFRHGALPHELLHVPQRRWCRWRTFRGQSNTRTERRTGRRKATNCWSARAELVLGRGGHGGPMGTVTSVRRPSALAAAGALSLSAGSLRTAVGLFWRGFS